MNHQDLTARYKSEAQKLVKLSSKIMQQHIHVDNHWVYPMYQHACISKSCKHNIMLLYNYYLEYETAK